MSPGFDNPYSQVGMLILVEMNNDLFDCLRVIGKK